MTTNTLRYLTPLALAISLAACHSRNDTTSTTTTSSDNGLAMSTNDATMSNAGDASAMASAGQTPAQTFADKAAKSDAFEIASARLALTNGSSPGVKTFAHKMIAQHEDSTAKIKQAAAAAAPAVMPNATLSDDQTAKLADLGKLKGAEFDKAYATGQVAAHEEALALMKDYAANGDAPALKAAAAKIAPVVQDHLVMARGLAIK